MPGLRGLGLVGAVVVATTTALASPASADTGVTPGIKLEHVNGSCTAGFAAQGGDGSYYLMTSGHCDAHDGSEWTYGKNVPLGKITASEHEGDAGDAAIIRLDVAAIDALSPVPIRLHDGPPRALNFGLVVVSTIVSRC